jgi:dTDP-4-amino-4,6-dideoxygalactose transaminase
MNELLPFGKPNFSEREIEAVGRVMRAGWVGMGPETLAFETELAQAVGVAEVVTVNSCTSAMLLSLLALGVRPGDEVICPSLTWCSTANVALHLGARPVFCDVDRHTLCTGVEQVLAALTPRTKAVMPVHFGGRAVDIAALRHALPPQVVIVEDAAHAFGARLPGGKPVGSSGHPTCFSFYANKVISTADGGAVALSDPALAERLRSLRVHGLSQHAWQRHANPREALAATPLQVLGYKANYNDLQASIGRVQLERQVEFTASRTLVAEIYRQGLADSGLGFQAGLFDADHSRHLFVVVLPDNHVADRPRILTRLRERGIGVTVHYPPLHLMPLYNTAGATAALPVTEWAAPRIMTLPIGSSMTADDAHRVVVALKQELAA